MDPFVGQIQAFGFNFAPQGWAICDGQLIAISQNSALFSLLGTTFGGDGQTTFALPDFRGRTMVGVGNGPGLSNYVWGQKLGTENVTLLTQNLPSHSHTLQASSSPGTTNDPAGKVLANTGTFDNEYADSGNLVAMDSSSVGNTGSNQPFSIVQPYTAVYICIAIFGVYPSRS